MPSDERVVTVFISYAHEDRRWCELLLDQLGALVNRGQIRAFDDSQIAVGTTWEPRIKQELESADIIVLIITAKFMRSKYCTTVELPRAIERQQSGVRVIPIVADHVDLGALPFQSLQMLPVDDQRNLKPLADWKDDVSRPLAEAARCIREAVEEVKGEVQSTPPPRAVAPVTLTQPRRRSRWGWAAGVGALAVLLVAAFVLWKSQTSPPSSNGALPSRPPAVPGNITGPAATNDKAVAMGGGSTRSGGDGTPKSTTTVSKNRPNKPAGNSGSAPINTPPAPHTEPVQTPTAAPPDVHENASPRPPSADDQRRELAAAAKAVIDCVYNTKNKQQAITIFGVVFDVVRARWDQVPDAVVEQLKRRYNDGATEEQQRKIVQTFHCP
jgi:hypothetical protein